MLPHHNPLVSRNCDAQLRVKLSGAIAGSIGFYFVYFFMYIVCDCARNTATGVEPTTVYNLRCSGVQQLPPSNSSS